MAINTHSRTWNEVVKFANERRSTAVGELINDVNSEQQRGIIRLIDDLLALPESKEPVTTSSQDYL
ncbi:hypothetical protein [Neptunomonas sp. XY-337]|uniref:hypothetical protein n=1 Tax=Neptunomonas sp. XY-337 TaxID=2561897 RepID=UPI0010AAFA9C|nr:hypothetical protein [Neptunomonas sp. XY-337]